MAQGVELWKLPAHLAFAFGLAFAHLLAAETGPVEGSGVRGCRDPVSGGPDKRDGVLDQGVVSVPVLFFAEELGNHDHVIVLHRGCVSAGGRDLGFQV